MPAAQVEPDRAPDGLDGPGDRRNLRFASLLDLRIAQTSTRPTIFADICMARLCDKEDTLKLNFLSVKSLNFAVKRYP